LLENALKCYQKAEGLNDADGVALHKLAKLYRRRGQNALAAEYYRKVLRRHEAEVGLGAAAVEEEQMQTLSTDDDARMDGGAAAASSSAAAAAVAAAAVPSVPPPLHPDAVDAMLFLTEYSLKVLGDLDVAEAFCARLLDAGGAGGATSAAGAPRDLAKALMAEIRQVKGHNTMKRALQQQQQRTLSATSTAAHTPAHQPQLLQQQQQSHASLRPSPSTPARPPGAAPAAAPVSASPGSFFSTPARSP
jgi:tetratricopeptide (TPR) repeat protein